MVWEALAQMGLPAWLRPLVEAVRGEARAALAAAYAATLCREEGCDPAAAVAAAVRLVSGGAPRWEELPRHVRSQAERALQEAAEAYLRSPASLLAQVVLDADALSRMGVLGLTAPATGPGLSGLLQAFAEAMSWAAAADYVLYTGSARRAAARLKPHTLAAAKWLAEELQLLGYRASPRTEASSGGLVSYIDLASCPCGRAQKTAIVKPRRECIEYRVEYDCCGETLGFRICTPESTRLR